jgi:MFS family permease
MAVVTLVATIRFIPESPVRTPGRVNVPATLALSGWLVALLVPVSQGEHWGWDSPRIIGLFAAAVVLFLAWVRIELRSREPLIDVRMMRQPAVWWTNISALLFGFGMYSLMVVIPAFMTAPDGAGYGFAATPTGVGLAMLPNTLGMLVIGLSIGRITGRFGAKLPLVVGGIVDAVAVALLAVAHSELWMIYLALTVFGLGMGLAFSSMTNLIVDAVPAEQTGVATGMNANIRTIGGSIGSQVVSAIIVAGVAPGALPPESGYTNGLVVMSVALLAAGLVALVVPNVRRARVASPEVGALEQDLEEVADELALAADGVLLAAADDSGPAWGMRRMY